MDSHPISTPRTYEDWLALTAEQKEEVKSRWCAYTGEGRAIPMMAAARLMMSNSRIRDIVVGIYHGGEYILNPTVSNEDFRSCHPWGPPWDEVDVFEGFRVLWLKESYEFDPKDAANFVGVWTTEDPACGHEFIITLEKDQIVIRGRCPSSNEVLQVRVVEFDGYRLHFEVMVPSSSRITGHWFQIQENGHCHDDMHMPVLWQRAEQ
jgi:hypothetical protein